MSKIPLEWVQRAPAVFLVPAHLPTTYPWPLVKQGSFLFGNKSFNSSSPFSLTQPRYNRAQAWCWKVFQMLVWFLITGLDRSSSWPLEFWLAQPSSLRRGQHGLWSHKWGGSRRIRRRKYLMKRHLQVWNPLWWEHCTCAEAELGSTEQGVAQWCAKWVPGQQEVGSLTPSSAFSLLESPFSSVPLLVEPRLQPWTESNAKFKSKSNAKT